MKSAIVSQNNMDQDQTALFGSYCWLPSKKSSLECIIIYAAEIMKMDNKHCFNSGNPHTVLVNKERLFQVYTNSVCVALDLPL